MVARRVGPGFGVGARGADAPQVGDAPDQNGRRVAEVLGQALLDGGGEGLLALGARGEEDVPGLDVRRDVGVAEGLEGGTELVHGDAPVAGDVDAAEQGDVAGHDAQPTGRPDGAARRARTRRGAG